jgi:ABC-type amino acid transport substrate-binding protein
MTLRETLISTWQQALSEGRDDIELEGETYPVTVSRAKGLRMVVFNVGPYRMVGIEQNPRTESRWAELARGGKRIMQFRCRGRYVANVCEGKLVRYPAWKALELPE